MERDDRGARMQDVLAERNLNTEVSAEITIPDYKPELRRLLRVRATALPTDCYVGAGTAEISGPVEFDALYAADDGSLWCVSERSEYRFSMPYERGEAFSENGGILCEVIPETEAVSGRVSAPRKLTARCRVRAKVCLYADRVLGGVAGAEDGSSELLRGETNSVRRFFGNSTPFGLSEEVIPENGNLRVVSAQADVFPEEAQPGSGSVRCRGEVCLKLLCAAEPDGGAAEVFPILRRIPFSEEVPVEGAEVNCACAFGGVCPEVSVTVEDGRILCEVSCVLSAQAARNETVGYTKDAYSTEREGESVCKTIPVSESICCRNGNFSLTANFPLSEAGIRQDGEAVDTTATVTLSPAEAVRGRWTIPGVARFQTVVGGQGEWSAAEVEVPFRYEIPEAEATSETAVGEAQAVPVAVKARIDGERIGVEAELGMTVSLCKTREIPVLESVREGAPVARQGAVCTVCYPAPDDTLWTVAKRYHVPVNDLAARNRLPESPAADAPDSLAVVRFLII